LEYIIEENQRVNVGAAMNKLVLEKHGVIHA